jgi:ABC-type multidrug transport system fused ATPase/permease subunit
MDAKRVYNTYNKWLTPSEPVLAEVPTPAPEKKMPFPFAIAAAAADALLPLVIDLFRGHGSTTAVRNADIIEKAGPAMVEIAKVVSGQQGVAEAVTAVLDSPEKSAAFRAAVEKDLDKLVGMIERVTKIDDDSRDRAAKRATTEKEDFAALLIGRQFMLLAALAAATVIAFGLALWWKASNEILVGLMVLFTGLVNSTSSKWATMIEYRFGSSSGSAAKDEIIAASKR